jgi:hypothetical protein
MTQPLRPDGVSRREFVRGVGVAALAASAVPLVGVGAGRALADDKTGPTPKDPAETAVARLYKSLKDDQKKNICFAFDDPKRKQVNNNWQIVKPRIDDLTAEQQELCKEIMKGVCSEGGYDRFMRQMDADYGGFEQYHVALFGEPGTDKPFEWVLTGRHDTLRADGNSVEGVAFGGPIFYGHDATGTGDDDAAHTDNVWWYQGEQANKIFKSLDDKQQARALVAESPADAPSTVRLRGDSLPPAGLAVADLDGQQKQMVQQLLKDLLDPFRMTDVEEVMECLRDAGGADKLRLTYYKDGDIGDDGTRDRWRVEGPAFVWYFRGSPHVHTWLNVARKAEDDPTRG